MKISVEFDSLEELKHFVGTISVGPLNEKALAVWAQAREAEIAEREEKAAPKKAPAAKPAPEKQPEPEEEEEKPEPVAEKKKAAEHTETDFKLLASQKVKEGKTARIKEFFAKWGGKKISEVLEKNADAWAEIYAEMEAL